MSQATDGSLDTPLDNQLDHLGEVYEHRQHVGRITGDPLTVPTEHRDQGFKFAIGLQSHVKRIGNVVHQARRLCDRKLPDEGVDQRLPLRASPKATTEPHKTPTQGRVSLAKPDTDNIGSLAPPRNTQVRLIASIATHTAASIVLYKVNRGLHFAIDIPHTQRDNTPVKGEIYDG